MVMVLVGQSYQVLEADSAPEALEVSRTFEGAINLLIVDHYLKTMTGGQLAEQMKKFRPQLKVLHTSGDLREKLEQEGGLIPGAAFLAKPFLPAALIDKVSEVLA